MLQKEYEGKNEKDAIRHAEEDLGISRDDLQIEIVQKGKSSFLGIGEGQKARIKVVYNEEERGSLQAKQKEAEVSAGSGESAPKPVLDSEQVDQYIESSLDFLEGLFQRMNIDVDIEADEPEDEKVFIRLNSPNSALIIGKRGKTLEAIQMLTNIASGRKVTKDFKSVIDIENYREKREDILTDLAHKVANEVRKSGKGKSLEPMNPFERRLIHLALQDQDGIETRSEGEGVYRKVRIVPKR